MRLKFLHLHLHGLIRSKNLELGRDADTGGQTQYVLELVKSLANTPDVDQVDLVTRLINDFKVDKDLIGGLKLQLGSFMIDTSIKNRLNKYKQEMLES